MKHGQPKLRSMPPKTTVTSDALARLSKLEEWTEEPSRQVAAALSVEEGRAVEVAPVPAEPKQPKPQPQRRDKPVVANPWDAVEVSSGGAVQSMNFKLPIELYKQLKWLGETTLGMSMTKIVTLAVEEKVAKMKKERGVS